VSDANSGDESTPRDEGSYTQSADSLRGRADENRIKLWVFFEADRRVLATAGAVVFFFALLAVGTVTPNVTGVIRSGDPIETAFQAYIGAIITGVTLIVTLNQLVLSQKFGTLDQHYDRFDETMDVRDRVAEHTGAPVSPSDPAELLRALVQASVEDADALQDAVEKEEAPNLNESVSALADGIRSNAEPVLEQLDEAAFGTFDVLSAALDFNYSLKVYEAHRIRSEYEDALSESSIDRLDELIATLELFAPAREHVKTLYIEWELIDLSRYVMGTAVPALIVAVCTLLFYSPGTPGGAVFGIPMAVVVISATTTVAVTPFLILLSYVLRVASVTKRTLAIGPFTLRDTSSNDE